MSNKRDTYGLRQKTDEELCEWIVSWNDQRGIGHRLLGQHELERRLQRPNAIRSWLAIGISVFAVVLSIVFHFVK
jgi:hypothetical protein